ncbi:MAG: diacylglycerol kinase [Atopostipes sp.]|nr:diacylglycerol kinase [Atopostipes sp.]
MKRARVIYNPSAGRELVKEDLPEILNVYEEAGYETSAFQTTPEPLSAQKEAARACEAGYDLVVAAGGDGTIHEVINGMAEKDYRPSLAILPAGTTNDYARVLDIPRGNLVEAAKLIEKRESIFMDIGKVTSLAHAKYFVNIGAMGNMAELTFEVSPQLKTIFGYLAYVIKGAELLPTIRPVPVEVEYNGGYYSGNATLIFVALTNSVGGFENIVPNKVLGNGKFSLIIVKSGTAISLMQLITRLLTDGSHLESEKVISVETDFVDVKIEDEAHLMVNLDGEYGGDAPVRFENLANHIEVIANMEKMRIDTDDLSEKEIEQMESMVSVDLSKIREELDEEDPEDK